jgi:sec-independent protein translocase protein TatA
MTPLVFGLGVWELLIILAVILLIFGGTRLAGLGKSTGRALREFKEETKGLKEKEGQVDNSPISPPAIGPDPGASNIGTYYSQPPQSNLQHPTAQDPAAGDQRNDT